MSGIEKYAPLTKCRLKKGDEVIVIAGKCKGDTGKIEKVDYKHAQVFISGVNIYKRHTRPSMSNQIGGIVEKAMPLKINKVSLLDPKKKVPTRVGYKVEGGKKVRYAKKSGTILA